MRKALVDSHDIRKAGYFSGFEEILMLHCYLKAMKQHLQSHCDGIKLGLG